MIIFEINLHRSLPRYVAWCISFSTRAVMPALLVKLKGTTWLNCEHFSSEKASHISKYLSIIMFSLPMSVLMKKLQKL